MSITVDLPPEVEARIQQEAKKRSIPVERYISQLVSETVPFSESDTERSLRLLRSVRELGDDAEQKETFEVLKRAVDEDRLSSRKRFA
jgi:hypothetical protein